MTFVRESSGVIISIFIVIVTLFILGGFKISEKKIELKENVKKWEVVSSTLEEENKNIVKEIEL